MTPWMGRSERAIELGQFVFGDAWRPSIEARANGRIEVIGNHVDYNGGPVVAAAVDRGISVLADRTSTGRLRAAFPDLMDEPPEDLSVGSLDDWRATAAAGPADYLRGVLAAAMHTGHDVRESLDIVVHGDIPVAGGVSSSAALCVGLALTILQEPIEKPAMVRLAQQAEHRAGTPCGTMDQSASVFGGIILFGGSPDNVTTLPAELEGHRFVVLGSGIHRSLAVSKYTERVDECQRALKRLRSRLGDRIAVLADVSAHELEASNAAGIFADDPTLYRRARHVVTEVARVRAGLVAMELGDWPAFGDLMNTSGRSSATDYDISHPVVEELVSDANTFGGVLGARMMGGGEGGNVLALVEESAIVALESHLSDAFYRPRELDPERMMFVCQIGDAASVAVVDRQ